MIIFSQSVTVLRPGVKALRGGGTVPDWSDSAVTRHIVTRVSVQPASQLETSTPERSGTVTGWRVYTAPGTDADVRAGDRVVFDGITCDVMGEVARWRDPVSGGIHHVEFVLQRAVG